MDDALQENIRLKARIKALEAQIEFLQTHKLLAQGVRGETLISTIVAGSTTAYAAMHDVETTAGERIEVKCSKLIKTDRRSISMKWQWAKLLGESGQKIFDYLVLLGETDARYRANYKDPNSPYVLFCIPFRDVPIVTGQGQRPEYKNIQLGTNPLGIRRSQSALLFDKYQITAQELADRFGVMSTTYST